MQEAIVINIPVIDHPGREMVEFKYNQVGFFEDHCIQRAKYKIRLGQYVEQVHNGWVDKIVDFRYFNMREDLKAVDLYRLNEKDSNHYMVLLSILGVVDEQSYRIATKHIAECLADIFINWKLKKPVDSSIRLYEMALQEYSLKHQ